jgi:hypothetical protein
MKLLRKIFKRRKGGESKAAALAAAKEDNGSLTGESNAGSQSTASVLEQTRIHVSTVVEMPSPEPAPKPEEAQRETAVVEGKPKTISSKLVCCKAPDQPQLDLDLDDDPQPIKSQQTKKLVAKPSPKATETIECVFNEYRQAPNELIPSLMESMSISTADGMNSPNMGSLLDITKVTRAQPCRCGLDCLPPVNPELWPQAPLLLRPDPKSGTKIIGIRKENTSNYLWTPENFASASWWRELQEKWGSETPKPDASPCCDRCVILPINNGNERVGEALVADFETALFKGTLLMRLRHSEGTTQEPSDDTKGFFAGVPLRYQAVIRGNFKTDMAYTELVTGTRLSRPCGKLPPKWAMWTALKVIGFFAPQLKAKLDVDKPYVLSPFGSAPRVVEVDDTKPADYLGDARLEPTTPERSLTGEAYAIKDPLERARARKRGFDKLYIANDKELRTDPSKTYTMEFLQHLFDYQQCQIDLGTMNFDALPLLDGQPLQLMAAQGNKLLWSFEIWNEALIEDAKRHAFAARNSGWTVKYKSNNN